MIRKGDWFIAPYQCEKCWFVNICGQLLRRPRVGDMHTLDLLHRANLGIFGVRKNPLLKVF